MVNHVGMSRLSFAAVSPSPGWTQPAGAGRQPVAADFSTAHRVYSPKAFRLGHRPSLNGIRAYAVLMVIEEWSDTGRIDFRSFYIRRGLRLFPALVAVIFAAAGLAVVHNRFGSAGGESTPPVKSMVSSILYLNDWVAAFKLWDLGPFFHTWSLSAEEQFYLVWPIALLALLRSRISRLGVLAIIGVGIVAAVVLRHLLWPDVARMDRATFGLDTNAASLLIGAALGVIATAGWLPQGARIVKPLRVVALASTLGVALFAVRGSQTMAFLQDGGYAVLALGAASIMWLTLIDQPAAIRVVLNNRVIVFIGTISYSLYLWHFLVFRVIHARLHPDTISIPLNLVGSFIVAILSYYVIERPFLRLKSRLAPSRASGGPPQSSISNDAEVEGAHART